jgi:transcriptional regulator with PAS, ATPase and Fis domain
MPETLIPRSDKGALFGLQDLAAEKALLRAVDTPLTHTLSTIVETIAQRQGIRFAVLVTKDACRRRLFIGRWTGGRVIGRPDKLVPAEQVRRVLESMETTWMRIWRRHDAWCSGLTVRTTGSVTGALFLEGAGADPTESSVEAHAEARRLAILVATAIAVKELKERLGRSWADHAPSASILEDTLTSDRKKAQIASVLARFPEVIGKSATLGDMLGTVLTSARTEIPVLIEGESGTGKELVAHAVHRLSERGDFPFVSENCGAISETLVESEFFGHEPGAFTGARGKKPGLFERAHGGTVFLDEVGEMDLSMQRKILRVLQEKEVRRLGGQRPIAVDFRLVSATNRVLEEMVALGKFRQDLFYRLNVVTINVPSLRERIDDIPVLVDHFNRLFCQQTGRQPLEFTEEAQAALLAYRWPGNIRELRNEVWRHASAERVRVSLNNLSRRIRERQDNTRIPVVGRPLLEIEQAALGSVIREALRESRGNRAEAARRLGITRSSLYRRMLRYGL